MKLLIYSHFFAPSIGGVETIVLSLTRGLSELRDSNDAPEFEVTLVTQAPPGDYDDGALPFSIVRRPRLFQLWRLIRSSDVVHVAGPALEPLLLARLARKPLVLEHHGYQAVCPNGLLLHQPDCSICPGHFQARRYIECWRCRKSEISAVRACISLFLMFPRQWLSRRVAANLAISQHVMQRISLARSRVVYYGVDDNTERIPVTPSSIASESRPRFAYVGRFVQEKGIPVLLRAAAILRGEGYDFDVRLIGDGPLRPELESLIQKQGLGSCVRITGYLTGTQLADALAGVSVVVMPSVWEETAGLAAIEHMMRGRPVIASDVGGLGEIVGDAGLKFTPGSSDSLADCMRQVLQEDSLIGLLGAKARDHATHLFVREKMIDAHGRVYREVVRSPAHKASSA